MALFVCGGWGGGVELWSVRIALTVHSPACLDQNLRVFLLLITGGGRECCWLQTGVC
jgi:hypothetical protein